MVLFYKWYTSFTNMNRNIQQLSEIAGKPERKIIGLMSGTSVDGLDIALCNVSGSGTSTELEILRFETTAYDNEYKDEVAGIFSKRQVDFERVCLLNAWIGRRHAQMILDRLDSWGVAVDSVDLIASHGQTVFHAPRQLHKREKFPDATLQIGDGDHIAVLTGIITLSDFRQKHIAAGGEGAPLAAYGDYLIFSREGENQVMLNIGGIANFTYLPGSLDARKVFSTDTGPGNTMMDAFVRKYYPGRFFDENAVLAGVGSVHEGLLKALLVHPFFDQPFPKTTGPELFNLFYLEEAQRVSGAERISNTDVLATLNLFSAITVTDAIKKVTGEEAGFQFYVSGGGMHNPLLLKNIRELLPGSVIKTTNDLHINPDAKEAVLFAVLANEAVAGGDTTFGDAGTGMPTVSMGKVSFPH